jgi:endonuclease/exonuclease/phosphatase family metal-dependent hydrolase
VRRPGRGVRKRTAVIAICLLALPSWYLFVRLLSPINAVRVIELNPSEKSPVRADVEALRVGCYNIAHGRGGREDAENWTGETRAERRGRLRAIAEHIRRLDLDVVVLNECDFDCNWSQRTDQAREIADAAGYPYVAEQRNYDMAAPFFSWRFGNAILSRFPIVEGERIRFRPKSKREALLAGNHDGLLCRLELADGRLAAILAIHLESRPPEDTRVWAAERLLALREGLGIPLLALGDFNSSPSGFPLAMSSGDGRNAMDLLLGAGGFHAALPGDPDAARFTFPAKDPDRKLDWILAPRSWKFRDAGIAPSELSDHLLVWSEIDLRSSN